MRYPTTFRLSSANAWALVALLGFALLSPLPAAADDVPWPPEADQQAKGREHAAWLRTRIDAMVTRLALPKAKADKVHAIVEEELQGWQNKQQSLPPGSQERLQARRETSHRIEDRIHALLTCNEREKYRLLRREMLEARQDRRAAGRGPAAPAAPNAPPAAKPPTPKP